MPKSVKDTLTQIGIDAHVHDRSMCSSCLGVWEQGRGVSTERVVYQTPWVFWVAMVIVTTFSIYCVAHPKVITKTITVSSPADLDTIRSLQDLSTIQVMHKRLAYQFIRDGKYRKALKELE